MNLSEKTENTVNFRSLLHGSKITLNVVYELLSSYTESFKVYQAYLKKNNYHCLQNQFNPYDSWLCWHLTPLHYLL